MPLAAYTRGLRQTATVWPPGPRTATGGRTYGDPVSIQCRWQDDAVLFRGPNGEELTSSAVVYVDRVLEIGAKIVLGEETGSEPVQLAREIRQVGQSPSLRATQQLNKVYL